MNNNKTAMAMLSIVGIGAVIIAALILFLRLPQKLNGGLASALPTDNAGYVIFPSDVTHERISQIVGKDNLSYPEERVFTPTKEDVKVAEDIFRSDDYRIPYGNMDERTGTIEEGEILAKGGKFTQMDNYYRQYYGIYNKNGQKEIHLFAIRKDLEKEYPDWRTKLYVNRVMDGGDSFYEGTVNVDTHKLLYIKPHGQG